MVARAGALYKHSVMGADESTALDGEDWEGDTEEVSLRWRRSRGFCSYSWLQPGRHRWALDLQSFAGLRCDAAPRPRRARNLRPVAATHHQRVPEKAGSRARQPLLAGGSGASPAIERSHCIITNAGHSSWPVHVPDSASPAGPIENGYRSSSTGLQPAASIAREMHIRQAP